MIQFPRRSVTRFFIPLIDVLTLLFCIFLLMPMIKPTGETQEGNEPSAPDLAVGEDPAQGSFPGVGQQGQKTSGSTQDDRRSETASLSKEREELEHLRNEKIDVLQRR